MFLVAHTELASATPYINNTAIAHVNDHYDDDHRIFCDWRMLRSMLLTQWQKLTPEELNQVGPYREKLAHLIETKHGISARLVENYLRNFERTLPVI